jgi:carbon-monoxide dehydrogenase medium subunit
VKAAPFDYLAAGSVPEAAAALAADDGAKVIAGGQSLVPLMALRLARPTMLVDINALSLDTIVVDGDGVRIGGLVRHRTLERHPIIREHVPLLAEAAALIGHPAIRRRGTIGGSLAHGDPVAELPTALVALGGSVVAHGVAGARSIPATELFEGFLTTALAPDELIIEISVPVHVHPARAAFCEWAPRVGDFATAGVGVTVERDESGVISALGAAACGVGSTPVALHHIGDDVLGAASLTDDQLREVSARSGQTARDNGADDDRAELVGLLAARALWRAAT